MLNLQAYAIDSTVIQVTLIEDGMPKPQIDGNVIEEEWQTPVSYGFTEGNVHGLMSIKALHDREFMYLLVMLQGDAMDDGQKDVAAVCFDTDMNRSTEFEPSDYCFLVNQDNKASFEQGFSNDQVKGFIVGKTIPEGFLAAASYSSQTAYYEFAVPLYILGHESEYGFDATVHDGDKNVYSVVTINGKNVIPVKDYTQSPVPMNWGTLMSPDRSMPEFPAAVIGILSATMIVAATMTRLINKKSL